MRDFFLILFLLVLTYIPWKQLLQLPIRSDGFYYMFNRIQNFWNQKYAITGFETGAVLFGGLFAKLFGPNISYYLWTELFVMLLIAVVFYFLAKAITHNKLVGFSASLIFAVSYFGNWDMYTVHCYCFFIERILFVPYLLISLLFLHRYLEENKMKFFMISLFFYFIGVGLAHFSVLFTAPFLLYPFFWKLFTDKGVKSIIKGSLIGMVYLGLSGFFVLIQQINESGLRPTWGFFEFLISPHKYPYLEKMSHQLVFWSQYPPLLRHMDDLFPFHHLTPQNASETFPFFLAVYLICAVFVYKRLPKQRPILLTTLFGTATIFYLNAYFHLYDIAQADANRYLYFPTILLALFWGHVLWAIFFKQKKLFVFFGITLLLAYYLLNTWLIQKKFEATFQWNRSTNAIFEKILTSREQLKKGTVVIGSYPEIGPQEGEFFTEQLGKGEVIYLTEDNPRWREIASASAHAIFLRYDRTCNCVREEKIK